MMKLAKQTFSFFLALVISLVFIAPLAFAQVNSGSGVPRNTGSGVSKPVPKLENPIKADSIMELVYTLVDIAFQIGSVVAVLAVIYVGFKFVLAQGSDSKIDEAKHMFFWTVVGIAVLFGSKVIAEIIQATVRSLGSY